jgi:RNA polymerase sigma factor (sigma-70 family)
VPDQHSNITDQQLMEYFYVDEDNQWLGVLFQRYTLLLFGVCMKYLKNEEEAKDAVQQVFLKAITELHRYRVQYFKSWLYMVAKNYCLMKIREKQGKPFTSLDELQIPDETDPAAAYQLIEKDRQLELMKESMDELNGDQKQCVTLFYLEKRSYQEISSATGHSIMKVKSHIQNGKRNLKIIMDRKSRP